jgi:hypothetical protein
MGRVANPELAALWRARVARQQQSGLSVAEFCRREDCTPAAFHVSVRVRHGRFAGGRRARAAGSSRGAVHAQAAAGGGQGDGAESGERADRSLSRIRLPERVELAVAGA